MRKKLIVIEDDEDILNILSRLFQGEGYEVITSSHGNVADLVIKQMPDLVLCDNWLPEMKGTELCKLLKQDVNTKLIPFILSSTSMNLPQLAKECGADSYLEKPFNIREVINIVKTYL